MYMNVCTWVCMCVMCMIMDRHMYMDAYMCVCYICGCCFPSFGNSSVRDHALRKSGSAHV